MCEQLKKRILPRINQVLDDPSPDPAKVEKMQNVLNYIRKESELMLDRQWIRVQLPDIKCLSIPIKLTRQPIKSHLVEHEKDLFRDLNDDDEKSQKSDIDPSSKKRKTISIDAADLFLLNPEPIRCHILESNSSTLSLSNAHILIHDNQKLILFDYQKKLNETRWNDNTYGILVDICWMPSICSFVLLTIHSVYLYEPSKSSETSYSPTKIDLIKPLERTHIFASVTSFDRDIYINYHKGVHLDQYRVSTSLQWNFERRFSKSNCYESKDVGMRDCRSDGQYLCLSIMQQDDFKWRLDLMSRDLQRVRRGIPMDFGENQHKFFSMLVPLFDQRWLFINWFTNKIWIVDQQGKTKLIKDSKIKNVRNVSLSPNRCFMAIRTEKPCYLKLYKLD